MTAPVRRKCSCGRRYLKPRARKCELCLKNNRKAQRRIAHVRNTYDLESHELAALKVLADGKCMGCLEPRRYELHVDHDHAVEREWTTRMSIRMLLCASCNGALRKAGDSASTLRRLADHLDYWPSVGVIPHVIGTTIDRRLR
jgi:hypothetical protein